MLRKLTRLVRCALATSEIAKRALFPFKLKAPIGMQFVGYRQRSDTPDCEPKIMFATIVGLADAAPAFEACLSIVFKRLGYSSSFVACGGALPACMWDDESYILGQRNWTSKSKRSLKCWECKNRVSGLARGLGAEHIDLKLHKTSSAEIDQTANTISTTQLELHSCTSAIRKHW